MKLYALFLTGLVAQDYDYDFYGDKDQDNSYQSRVFLISAQISAVFFLKLLTKFFGLLFFGKTEKTSSQYTLDESIAALKLDSSSAGFGAEMDVDETLPVAGQKVT